MLKRLTLGLAPLALLLVATLTLSGASVSATPEAAPAAACSVAATAVPAAAGGPFIPLCAPTNDAGCSLSDIVCSGHNCCCVYSCPDSSVDVGPCWRTSPIFD